MDVNRQAWASSIALLVHPSNLYIGIRSERYFVGRGTPLKIEFIVTDLDGNPVSDRPVTITAARMEWKHERRQMDRTGGEPANMFGSIRLRAW